MRSRLAASAAVGLLAAASAAAAAAPSSDAAAFVRKLYADLGRTRGDPTWWRALAPRPHALLRHVLRVQKQSGDALIDEDFLCQCQETDGLKITSIALSPAASGVTNATVHLSAPGEAPYIVTLALVNRGGWKIAEITNAEHETLTHSWTESLKAYPGR